jgi:transcriptional regulator with XRE-family HTH domain
MTDRAREAGALLRRCREGLKPADVGLPDRARRRTPGLRREEVADLASISLTYYTYLEQGRPMNPSTQVLAALSAALRMTPTETRHLHELVHGMADPSTVEEVIPAQLVALVDRLDPAPAYVTGRSWDVLASNLAARQWWTDWQALPAGDRNMLVFMLIHDESRSRFADWEMEARALLGRFRVSYSRHAGDPQFEALLHRLLDESSVARRWWPRHEVAPIGPGRKTMVHPELGEATFDHVVLTPTGAPELKVVVFERVRR